MIRKFLVCAVAVAAIAFAGMVFTAPGSSAQSDVIKERQQAMKNIGGGMKVLAGTMKGEMDYSDAKVDEAAQTILVNLEKAATLFPEGSDEGDTRAKPEIWQNMDEFKAALGKAMDGAKAVMASTDEASFKAAFPELGGACGGCHKQFRKPKE